MRVYARASAGCAHTRVTTTVTHHFDYSLSSCTACGLGVASGGRGGSAVVISCSVVRRCLMWLRGWASTSAWAGELLVVVAGGGLLNLGGDLSDHPELRRFDIVAPKVIQYSGNTSWFRSSTSYLLPSTQMTLLHLTSLPFLALHVGFFALGSIG